MHLDLSVKSNLREVEWAIRKIIERGGMPFVAWIRDAANLLEGEVQ
jgi:hypothetical protein